jgi:hypothetical protein
MAADAYSGTPLPKKLGIREGTTVALVGPRGGFDVDLPAGAREVRGKANVVLLFARNQAELDRRFAGALARLDDPGRLWIAWPKRASGLQTDLGEVQVRGYGMGRGLVDYKVAALDAIWSGLCFARREE